MEDQPDPHNEFWASCYTAKPHLKIPKRKEKRNYTYSLGREKMIPEVGSEMREGEEKDR